MGIASVQRTYGIDPKVLGSVALEASLARVRNLGVGVSMRPEAWARLNQKRPVPPMDFCGPAGVAIYEEFFALLGGVGAMQTDGMRRWEGGTWSK